VFLERKCRKDPFPESFIYSKQITYFQLASSFVEKNYVLTSPNSNKLLLANVEKTEDQDVIGEIG